MAPVSGVAKRAAWRRGSAAARGFSRAVVPPFPDAGPPAGGARSR